MSKANKEIYTKVSNFFRWDMFEEALDLLEQNPDLDTTYNNGEFIIRAVSADKPEVVSYLIDHYNGLKTQNILEHQKALHKLQKIITEANDSSDISDKMELVISSYIKDNKSDDEQSFLGDYEDDS